MNPIKTRFFVIRESVIAFTFGLMILTMRMRFSYPDFYECTLSSDPFNFGLNLGDDDNA